MSVPWLITFCWSICRILSIITYGESSPPGIGFLLAPFSAALFACVFRVVKIGIYEEFPCVHQFETMVRLRCGKLWRKRN